ncbi:hypothetical protein pipiens_007320, partial [Culex pipiens pipiens]
CLKIWDYLESVAGVSATTERLTAPPAPPQGHSPLQLLDEPHMSIAAAENAGEITPEDRLLEWMRHSAVVSASQ